MANRITWEEAKNYLRKYREEQVRDSAYVVSLWENVLQDYSHRLGDELWLVYEQVCMAALDCRHLDVARECIEALEAKFPESMRVQRLNGMFLEAECRYEKATELYNLMIAKDSTNIFAMKRLVAVLKAQRKTQEAIKALNEYLGRFMLDYEGWMELCDLYLGEQDYSKAAFCMEEVILSNPHNHLFHQKFAEIKYSLGGPENMEQARSYFSQAVKLNPNNTRALYGLFLSAITVATSFSKGTKDKQSNIKYAAWALEQLAVKYKTQQSEEQRKSTKVLESLDKMLESVQASTSS